MTTLQEALAAPGCERIKDFYNTGPVQRAAVESFVAALAQQGEPVCHGCGIPAGDVHMSTCKSGKWPSRVSNGDTAAPAQQPVAYITDTEQGPMVWTPEMYDEACTYCDDGEFPVPLYTVAPQPTSGDYALGYAEGFNDACKPAPQAQEPCPNGSKCKHGAWCTEVYCQELCEFRNQPVAQPLSDSEIEKLREKTFSTNNPYCPVDSKSMRKAVRAA